MLDRQRTRGRHDLPAGQRGRRSSRVGLSAGRGNLQSAFAFV